MDDHLETLAIDLFFGGAMEMELHQFVGLAGQGNRIVADGDLNSVAVIDDAESRRPVLEGNRLDIDLDPIPDVDRRLTLADRAGGVFRVEFGPVFRPPCP